MKKMVSIACVLLLLLSIYQYAEELNYYSTIMNAYYDFLDGNISVEGINIDFITIPTGEEGFIRHVFGAGSSADYYWYFVFNYEGDLIEDITFSNDSNENSIYDENDEYVFSGVKITKEEWEKLTEEYIYVDERACRRDCI